MPDPNKLERLAGIGYRVLPTCGRCASGRFAPGLAWGSCVVPEHAYDHAKHGRKMLSVHVCGTCPRFTPNERKAQDLQRSGFDRFEASA